MDKNTYITIKKVLDIIIPLKKSNRYDLRSFGVEFRATLSFGRRYKETIKKKT